MWIKSGLPRHLSKSWMINAKDFITVIINSPVKICSCAGSYLPGTIKKFQVCSCCECSVAHWCTCNRSEQYRVSAVNTGICILTFMILLWNSYHVIWERYCFLMTRRLPFTTKTDFELYTYYFNIFHPFSFPFLSMYWYTGYEMYQDKRFWSYHTAYWRYNVHQTYLCHHVTHPQALSHKTEAKLPVTSSALHSRVRRALELPVCCKES